MAHNLDFHHHEHEDITGRRLIAVLILNIVITIVQAAGGFISGSLALLSDALHNLSDIFAVLISYIGNLLARVENSERRTFGLRRAEVIAAFINAVSLFVLSVFLFREAYFRLLKPEQLDANIVVAIGLFGLIGNSISMWLLHLKEQSNLNTRSAFLHMAADAFTSVAVIIGALLMKYYGIFIIDPVLTFIIGAVVLYGSYELLSESLRILLQIAPAHINVVDIKNRLEKIPGISNVHHIHLWSLSDKEIFFEAHVETSEDTKLSAACGKIAEIEKVLKEEFGITHTTVQLEFEACEDKSLIRRRLR